MPETYVAVLGFHVPGDGGPREFEEHLDCVDDALSTEPQVLDVDFTASLAEQRVTVEIAVSADDEFDAAGKAVTLLRSAVHGCHGGTQGWPSIKELSINLTGPGEEPVPT